MLHSFNGLEKETKELTVPFNVSIFKEVVKYCYTGTVSVTATNVVELCLAADYVSFQNHIYLFKFNVFLYSSVYLAC
jgi:hypothetical protein